MRSGVAIKRFLKRDDWVPPDISARREWQALTLVDKYAPGLAPTPVEENLAAPEPMVIMSRLQGTVLRGVSVRPEQLTAMVQAVITLYRAIPPHEVAGLPPRLGNQGQEVRVLHAWGDRLPQPSSSPVVADATSEGLAWLARSGLERAGQPEVPPVFGQADGNLENFLWDGSRVQIVDFEYSGRSDRAYELADIAEHVSAWVDTGVDDAASRAAQRPHSDLTGAEAARLRDCRRMFALAWLKLLLLQDPPHPRNPPGTVERQARRLLDLLD